MTKHEFIQRLKEALTDGMSGADLQEQLNYYRQYIEDEVSRGRSETEVVAELGDPWAIARTILDTTENEEFAREDGAQQPRRSEARGQEKTSGGGRVHIWNLGSRWSWLLIILGAIGIFMLLSAVLSGLIVLFARFFIPIMAVVIIVRLIRNRR